MIAPDDSDSPERLAKLQAMLLAKDEIEKYRGATAKPYKSPSTNTGYTSITVLPELTGLPLSNLVLAYIHGLNPWSIRVSNGGTDCM